MINLYHSGQLTETEQSCRELLQSYPRSSTVLCVLGAVLQDLGRLEQAVMSFDKALQINPDYTDAYYNRGIALQKLGQLEAAMRSYDEAIQLKPAHAEAYYNRGITLRELGQLEQAVKSYDKALQIKTDYADAYYNLGITLQNLGQLEAAIKNYDKAIQLEPDYANAYLNHGNTLYDLGQPEAATKSFDMAIRLKPDFADAYYNRGAALEDLGQPEQAVKSFKKALQIKPDFAKAHYSLSKLKEYQPHDAQIELIESLLTDSDPSESDRKYLCFALAEGYEELGEYDKSFDYLEKGNRLRKKELNYNIDDDTRLMTKIREIFAADSLTLEVSPNGNASIQSLFIIGMPRSGTSLVEQILASHSKVHGAGELDTMGKLVGPIVSTLLDQNVSQDTRELSRNGIERVHDGYLEKLAALKVSEKIITDKMPLNFLWIGHILCAFPGSKIIHLNRDPRATCWSIYKHYFAAKGNGFAYDLADLVAYYKLYIDLMSFWRNRFPNTIYDLCYEELTENQETETRKLLAYCDLQWEKQCLDFHQTKRTVKTASSSQVRKKMFQGSSEAWRKYAAHLKPLIEGLGY